MSHESGSSLQTAVLELAERTRANPWLWRIPIITGLGLIGILWTLVWTAAR